MTFRNTLDIEEHSSTGWWESSREIMAVPEESLNVE